MVSQITTQEIVEQFSGAVRSKDMARIAMLLADNGEYNTQDAELNTITDSNKVQFLDWLTKQLSQNEVAKIEYDTCILCRTGNPVVLFNEGLFVLQQEHKAKSRQDSLWHNG